MLLTWGPVVRARNIARSLGLTRVLSRLQNSSDYEERFSKAMADALRPGEVAWDVGANKGYYTLRFSSIVGATGTVVAFEPVPACHRVLVDTVQGCTNVRIVHAGLSDKSGVMSFDLGDGSNDTTARIVDDSAKAATTNLLQLPVYTAEEAARTLDLPAPNFVKIDVEGFELDVLRGMKPLVAQASCRNVFIEVHFGVLHNRGLDTAPQTIVDMLTELGFSVRWVDSGHIHASRS